VQIFTIQNSVISTLLSTTCLSFSVLPPPPRRPYNIHCTLKLIYPNPSSYSSTLLILSPSVGLNGPWLSTEVLVRSTECDRTETYDSHKLRCKRFRHPSRWTGGSDILHLVETFYIPHLSLRICLRDYTFLNLSLIS